MDKSPAYARLLTVATAGDYPQLLNHHPGRDRSGKLYAPMTAAVTWCCRRGIALGRKAGASRNQSKSNLHPIVAGKRQ